MKKVKRKIIKSVKALDNWHPTFEDETVKVSFTPATGRLNVWGDDDFGMEMPEDNATREDFDRICSQPITIKRCKEMGMVNA